MALAERLKQAGPGAPGTPLPEGLELLQQFQQEVEVLAKQRDALRLAEQLFDMDVTGYPALAEVRGHACVSAICSIQLIAISCQAATSFDHLNVWSAPQSHRPRRSCASWRLCTVSMQSMLTLCGHTVGSSGVSLTWAAWWMGCKR